MGKKNRSASSSQTKTIDQLKNLNDQLVKEVTKCRKQIEQLQFQITILVSHHNTEVTESERNVSPSFTEAAAHGNTKMAMNMIESNVAQLDTAEMQLLAVYEEKDEIQSNMNHCNEEKDCTIPCMEQSMKIEDAELGGGRKWKKWICSADPIRPEKPATYFSPVTVTVW